MILPSCYVKNFFIHFSNFHISYIWKNIIYFSFSPSFYLLINFHYFYTFHLPSYLLLPSISCSHIRLHSTHIQAIPIYEPHQNQWRDHFHPRVLFHPFPGLHHPLVAHSTVECIHLRSRAVTFLRLTQPFCSSAA